jgi:hypothetical protein
MGLRLTCTKSWIPFPAPHTHGHTDTRTHRATIELEENIFANHTSDNGAIHRICKELLKYNDNKMGKFKMGKAFP